MNLKAWSRAAGGFGGQAALVFLGRDGGRNLLGCKPAIVHSPKTNRAGVCSAPSASSPVHGRERPPGCYGIGLARVVPEQAAAIEALTAIGGQDAAQAVSTDHPIAVGRLERSSAAAVTASRRPGPFTTDRARARPPAA
jgi:hypothetical protein